MQTKNFLTPLDFIFIRRRLYTRIIIPAGIIFSIASSITTTLNAINTSNWSSNTFLLMFLLAYFLCFGVILQFSFFALACRDRFKLINEKIALKFQPTSHEIITSVDLFKELLKIMHKINDTAQSLILIFAHLLLLITINIYSATKLPFFFENSYEDFILISQNCLWIAVVISQKLILIYSTQSAFNQAEIFLKLIKDILWHQQITNEISRRKIEFFILSIDRTEIKFKTIFFDIDWKLLFKVRFIRIILKINSF